MSPVRMIPARLRSLRWTLVLPVVTVALLTGVALLVVGWASTVELRRLEAQTVRVRHANALVFRMNQLASDTHRLLLSYRFRPEERTQRELASTGTELAEVVRQVSVLELPPRGRALWASFLRAREREALAQAALVEAVRTREPGGLSLAFERWDLATARSGALLADFSAYNARLVDAAVADLDARRTRSLMLVLGLVAAAAVLAIPFALFVGQKVAVPLVAMSRVADRVARERLPLQVEGGERRDELGLLARSFNAMTDDLVRTNERLSAALRIRDEFISAASHELRTPLTALRLQLELAQRSRPPAEPAPPWAGVFDRQVKRLEVLTGQMLDVARLRTGRLALEPRETSLANLVRKVAARLAPEAEGPGASVALELQEGVTGRWDPERLDQVLANLLQNALRHAAGRPVTVRLAARGDRAILSVKDEGPGIDPAAQARIFEPFERGHDGRRAGGLGLGLYIAREIVAAHGGTLTLSSEPGRGATFTIELPGVLEGGATGTEAEPAIPSARAG